MQYTDETISALKAYRAAKPWRGSLAEQKEKLVKLHSELTAAVGQSVGLDLSRVTEPQEPRGNGGIMFREETPVVVLVGKISVVTYLFCFAGAVYQCRREDAFNWASTLYRRIFPRSAERMTFANGCILKGANSN